MTKREKIKELKEMGLNFNAGQGWYDGDQFIGSNANDAYEYIKEKEFLTESRIADIQGSIEEKEFYQKMIGDEPIEIYED